MTHTSSLTANVTPVIAGAHVIKAGFLGRMPVFALSDGSIVLSEAGEDKRVLVHEEGAILCAATDGKRLYTGGDDGKLFATAADCTSTLIADENGTWIDTLIVREDGALAWNAGREVRARDARGEVKSWRAPTTPRGLAFYPKGFRLGIAHYNGISLWFPNTAAAPERLEWKGSHLDLTFSPDGRFAVTSMQEHALHGWRIADKADMRMTGYPAKTRSVSWSQDGNWLATSGAEACVIWPFQAKGGPMGQSPRECGVRPARVSATAFHPKALILAIGYEDGWILLCRLQDGSEILVRSAPEGSTDAVSALVWDDNGRRLAFGTTQGAAGLLTLPV